MLEMTIGYFRHFLKEIFASDNFREKMTSALCYLIGVRVILCDFWSGVYHVGPWEGSLNRTFPVHTLLCLYVKSFLGILYFCPEGCLIARQSKYNCLATQWPCLWNGRWLGYLDAYHHMCYGMDLGKGVTIPFLRKLKNETGLQGSFAFSVNQ